MTDTAPPRHGGNPQFLPAGCDTRHLLDLATGINPWPWPMAGIDLSVLQTLPYFDPHLQRAAADYYGVDESQLLAVAGSQPAIQLIPQTITAARVLMPAPAYEEHSYRWCQAGHECLFFPHDQPEQVAASLDRGEVDHLLLVNPNNPTGQRYTVTQMLQWRKMLPPAGLLIVDQAYADTDDLQDTATLLTAPGVVLLRSVGKFFGLPGLRLGFVLGEPALVQTLDRLQGPWGVNSLAQAAGARMLADRVWQAETRQRLVAAAERQRQWLAHALAGQFDTVSGTPLFNCFEMPLARGLALQQLCYRHGLSVRVYPWQGRAYMRWGLAADEDVLRRQLESLCQALAGDGKRDALFA